ncbi:hypothetical protein INS49_002486 [Diaporthe citri]|uniref:uncharacterized protein n=1 Tax=Diaporthe citri TaxID=83186 RepID=UPI001C822264|nr:uncharacterized protein INS49_002486 [Diaporthe citri]KAG6368282.1 hypothetical protein INS49_002486 [Diaporthe citri]
MSVEKKHEDVAQWQDALISHVVDRLAHGRRSAEYGEWVMGSIVVSITYLQLVNVIDGLAWWLLDQLVAEIAQISSLQSPELLDFCAENLETILYIGGDLPQDLGDRIAAKMYLRCLWGATETGIVPQLLPEELLPSSESSRTLWRYIRFHPCIGSHFHEVSEGDYELVIRREEALANMQPCFTVPGLNLDEEYRTKDLFERHPTIPDLWRWRARADDIITFLNGEKTNPISMEHHIMASNPELSGVLVIGAQRFQAALLLEPASDESLSTAPAHARVEKFFILVVPSDRRLIRAGKGTFMRGASISQYSEEIEKLYERAEAIPHHLESETVGMVVSPMGLDGVTRLIRQEVHTIMGWSNLGDTEGLLDRGMDSLQALQLTRALRRSFHRPDVALSTVYQNPTVSQLAAIIQGQTHQEQDKEVMKNLLETYKGRIQQIAVSKNTVALTKNAPKRTNVMVTGTTGTVGTHLLRALLDNDSIGHIFCLNRREDGGRAGQFESFAAAGFDLTQLGDNNRVTFLKVDLQAPSLGLEGPVRDDLCSKVDLIIHSAWPVNFNFALLAFRPHLAGLVNLLALAAATVTSRDGQPCRFLFISSIAAVAGYQSGSIPEKVLTDFDMSAPLGYGQSKLLAELLMDAAAQKFGESVLTTIVRVGQVAGAVRSQGLWNSHEWFPSMVLSALHFGQVPGSLGPYYDNVDFLPVDMLGSILIEIATATQAKEAGERRSGALVYNLRNPHPAPWRELLTAVTNTSGRQLKAVPPAAWLGTLRASIQELENNDYLMARNPAVKLSDFFEKLWAADTGSSANGSCTLGNLASYAIDVRNADQVIAGVRFAKEKNIRLTIKSTGHDFCGNIASARGYRVVGGSCPTVGLAGGFTQGGGHGPLGGAYGLAADQVLEWEVVTAAGDYLTASSTQNAELFWALSGGGAGNFAVVLSVAVRAYADGPVAGAGFVLANSGNSTAFWSAVTSWLQQLLALDNIRGLTTVWTLTPELLALEFAALTDAKTTCDLDKALAPFLDHVAELDVALVSNYTAKVHASFAEHYKYWATQTYTSNISLGGRLIPRSTVEDVADSLPRLVAALRNISDGGAKFLAVAANVNRSNSVSNAMLPSWRDALFTLSFARSLAEDADWDAISANQKQLNEWQRELREITPGGGTYMNEATWDNVNWKEDYFGANYDALLRAKEKYDLHGLFWANVAVGNDKYWKTTRDGRLCRV